MRKGIRNALLAGACAVALAGGGAGIADAASTAPTVSGQQVVRQLPRWFDWTYATWATTHEVCGKRAARRAIVVWARNLNNDNSAVMCANGRFALGS